MHPPQCRAMHEIGCRLRLQTAEDQEIEGTVFACDSEAGVITLQQPGTTPFHQHLRLVKEDFVKTLLQSVPPEEPGPSWDLPVVDERRTSEREERAVRIAQQEAAKIGVNVTGEAQKIFDALAKTLPCRWDGETIVVLEEIFISKPYSPDDCESLHPDDVAAMERVKKVLLAERSLLFGA